MPVVLFAILGVNGYCGAGYWICFAVYCVLFVINAIRKAANETLW